MTCCFLLYTHIFFIYTLSVFVCFKLYGECCFSTVSCCTSLNSSWVSASRKEKHFHYNTSYEAFRDIRVKDTLCINKRFVIFITIGPKEQFRANTLDYSGEKFKYCESQQRASPNLVAWSTVNTPNELSVANKSFISSKSISHHFLK